MQIPGYKIVDTLGRGGMATVYLAIQESFEREVALKVLNPELLKDPAFGARFLREARIVSRLVHPNIVTVYDVGEHEGHHYLSMEYVPGKDLKVQRTKLSRTEALQVVKDIARALDYAARKGYVHRDVKPENIMLHGEDGRAVLMDFGIARPTGLEQGVTQTGTAIGTPHYMSPEQAKGKPVDARSDLYSLGVVLFLLITGRVPYDADSAVAVGIKHVAEPVPRLPAPFKVFQPIIDRVLAKNPDERYQTGSELVEDLEQITSDDLRRVDELIELAAKRMQADQADPDSPTLISSALDEEQTGEIVAANTAEQQAVAQHWPQSGQSVPVRTVVQAPTRNPFGGSHWLLSSVLIALLLVSAVFFLRVYLPSPWPERVTQWHHQGLDQLVAWGLPIDQPQWHWLYDLGGATATGTKPEVQPTPVQTQTPVTPAAPTAAATAQPTPVPTPTHAGGPTPADAVLADTRPVLSEQGLRTASTPVSDDPFTQADALLAKLPEDLSKAVPLAQIYRQQMSVPAHRARAQQGLEQVRQFYSEQMRAALAERDLERVRDLMESARSAFPKLANEARFRRLQKRLLEAEEIEALLAQGQAQLARDALSSPAGDNAVESFEAVLAKKPNQAEARAGLQAVANRYQALAQAKLNAGDWLSAKGMVKRGLRVAPDHTGLLALQEQVAGREQQLRAREASISTAISAAETALAAGKLLGDEGALARYQQVLKLDPDHAGARQGLNIASQRWFDQVKDLINQDQFDTAASELAKAKPLLAGRAEYIQAQNLFNQAVAERQPRLDLVRVSAFDAVDFERPQPVLKGVQRTIYIGVQFAHFETAAVVQAILYDGARSVQIAQVPVVLSGAKGQKVFRIDRPVEGFAAGGYHIDLMLEKRLLISQPFQLD